MVNYCANLFSLIPNLSLLLPPAGELWPMYVTCACIAVFSYSFGKWLHNRLPTDIIVLIILGLVWLSGFAFLRLFEPNTLSWVGLGFAVLTIAVMIGVALFVCLAQRRRLTRT